MKLLTDQDVYSITVQYLQELGNDVVTAEELGLARAKDTTLLRTAQDQQCIQVTRDRDFGGLVFVMGLGFGVVYLRMLPTNLDLVHAELERVLYRSTRKQNY